MMHQNDQISLVRLLVVLPILVLASCQNQQEMAELRVGDYYTEEESRVILAEYAKFYNTADEWIARAKSIQDNIFKGAELDKIPNSDWSYPISVKSSPRIQMDGYSVENLALEVRPGYFITGNLYLPDSIYGKIPVVLCPHGHWHQSEDYGRFRADMQLRCASLARMGSAVFAYDMYGYGEDIQHYHKDPKALKWQTYNGIRILDYMSSLNYVDTSRIAITGASGGGTQSFVLAAIDERIDVSVPVVMVSSHFFGGCVCESGLPIHKSGNHETNNVEIAASIAPKPLMLISDGDDWTRNVPEVEYPYIKSIYSLFEAEGHVEYAHFEEEQHDYGPSKRKPAYKFLAKHLRLDLQKICDVNGKINENFVTLLDTTALKVFPERHIVKDPYLNHLEQ